MQTNTKFVFQREIFAILNFFLLWYMKRKFQSQNLINLVYKTVSLRNSYSLIEIIIYHIYSFSLQY